MHRQKKRGQYGTHHICISELALDTQNEVKMKQEGNRSTRHLYICDLMIMMMIDVNHTVTSVQLKNNKGYR